MKISFYKRGGVLQARISDREKTLRFSTGIKRDLPKQELDQQRQKLAELYLKYRDIGIIKDEFNYTPEPDENDYSLASLLKSYVHRMMDGEMKTKSGRLFSNDSIRTYAYIGNVYSDFVLDNGDINLPDYHIDPSWPIERKQRIAERYNKHFKKLDEWLIKKNNGLKSRFNMFNMIGIMVGYWSQLLFLNVPRVMKTPNVSKPIVTFPPDFVMKFLKDDDQIYDKLDPDMKMVWEVSATILITTMRVSDVISLEPRDFNAINDTMYLNKRNKKTNAMSQSPLPKFLADKYRDNLNKYGRVYTTTPSKNKIYEHMRGLFRMYEEMHEWFTVSKLGVMGEEVTESKPLYEWAHPHLLRKTAITTMIANKVPDRHIKFLSGHSENSSSFGKYVGHVEKNYQSDMLDYFKNFN